MDNVSSQLKSEKHQHKSDDVSSMTSLLRLQKDDKIRCVKCHAPLFQTDDSHENTCRSCKLKEVKQTEENARLLTNGEILKFSLYFIFSFSIVLIKPLWFVPPFLFTALVIELYQKIGHELDQKISSRIRRHYNKYKTYNLHSKTAQDIYTVRTDEMYNTSESNMIHLEDVKVTILDKVIYNMVEFLKPLWSNLFYLRLAVYCLGYMAAVILTLAFFYWLSHTIGF